MVCYSHLFKNFPQFVVIHTVKGFGIVVYNKIFKNCLGFPDSLVGKESTCNAGDSGSIPGLGRSPEGGHGNPLQYSCQWPWINCLTLGFPGGSDGDKSAAVQFDPWVRKIPWRRKWQSTPVFFPGESHGQRSLTGYSPWGRKSWT